MGARQSEQVSMKAPFMKKALPQGKPSGQGKSPFTIRFHELNKQIASGEWQYGLAVGESYVLPLRRAGHKLFHGELERLMEECRSKDLLSASEVAAFMHGCGKRLAESFDIHFVLNAYFNLKTQKWVKDDWTASWELLQVQSMVFTRAKEWTREQIGKRGGEYLGPEVTQQLNAAFEEKLKNFYDSPHQFEYRWDSQVVIVSSTETIKTKSGESKKALKSWSKWADGKIVTRISRKDAESIISVLTSGGEEPRPKAEE